MSGVRRGVSLSKLGYVHLGMFIRVLAEVLCICPRIGTVEDWLGSGEHMI